MVPQCAICVRVLPHRCTPLATGYHNLPRKRLQPSLLLQGVGTAMYDFFVKEMNGGTEVDKEASFFCGDAGGRDGDHAGTDKEFAEKVGIPFKLPEDLFGEMEGKAPPKPGAATHVLKGEASTSVNADLVNTLAVRIDGRMPVSSTHSGFDRSIVTIHDLCMICRG